MTEIIEKFKAGALLKNDKGLVIRYITDANSHNLERIFVEIVEIGVMSQFDIKDRLIMNVDVLMSDYKIKKKKVWVNFYRGMSVNDCLIHCSYESKEDALKMARIIDNYIGTFEAEIND